MTRLIGPEVIQIFNKNINQLRDDLGRAVVVIKQPKPGDRIDCPNCGYDSPRRRSNNRYQPTSPYPTQAITDAGITPVGPVNFPALGQRICPVCDGAGRITLTGDQVSIICLINHLAPVDAENTPLGKNYQFNYELQCGAEHRDTFKAAKRVVIDGNSCVVVATIPTGIGDTTQLNVYAGGGV